MPIYTVIGIYSEPMGQRYATTAEAATPADAERAALAETEESGGGLMVAGVVAGSVEMLDLYTDGYTFGVPGVHD